MKNTPQINNWNRSLSVKILITSLLLIVLPVILAGIIIMFPSLTVNIDIEYIASQIQNSDDEYNLESALDIAGSKVKRLFEKSMDLNLKPTATEKIKRKIAKWVRQISFMGSKVCPWLKDRLKKAKLRKLAERLKCEENIYGRLFWACLSLAATVSGLFAIHYAFPKYREPRWLYDIKQVPKIRRPVSIKVCTSAKESNVQALIKELSRRSPKNRVEYVSLPYNGLDRFSFEKGAFDVIILCHSIHNRRFAITDVIHALYNEFLAKAERAQGKKKVCVIAHDFPMGNLRPTQRYEDEMTAFRLRQPSTFKHSNLAMMVGRLDRAPAELSQDQWKELDDFIKEAEVAGRPLEFYDIRVPILLIASLMVVLFFVPALIKNTNMVVLFVVTFVAALTWYWRRRHLILAIGICLVMNALSLYFKWSPYSRQKTMVISGCTIALVTLLALFDKFYIKEQNAKRD